MAASDLERELAGERRAVEKALRLLLREEKGIPQRLRQAMRHSLLAGGKRLRPILLLWTWDAVTAGGAPPAVGRQEALRAACGLEMLHTYSLIHDDLPAMDDDDMRRGAPACHVAFDEATAILAGDALQALAFGVLGRNGGPVAGPLVSLVADAVGPAGMVGGQQCDLDAEGTEVSAAAVRRIHTGKTARLLMAAMEAGVLLGGGDASQGQSVATAALDLGLAFQGADDVLDVTATNAVLGKSVGKDAASGKATWVRIEGLKKAQVRAQRLGERGLDELAGALPAGPAQTRLLALGRRLWHRKF